MTTTEHAAELRRALKSRGWSSRKVSVRADYFSMGSAIRVHVKDPDVPLDAVKAIAEGHERIDHCAITGEILSGCNRYVTVSLTCEAAAVLRGRWLEPVRDAISRLAKGNPGDLERVEGTPFLVGGGPGRWSVWDDGRFRRDAYRPEDAAEYIGERMVEERVRA